MRLTKWRAAGGLLAGIALLGGNIGGAGALTSKVATITAAGSDTTYQTMLDMDALYEFSPGCTLTSVPPATHSPAQVGDGTADNTCSTVQPSTGVVTTENYSHDVVSEYYPQGSGAGLYELCHQGASGIPKVNFARASRAPDATKDCTGLIGTEFALDGIAPVTFPGNVSNAIDNYNAAHPGTPFGFTKASLQQLFATCVDSGNNQLVFWDQLDNLGPAFPHEAIQFYSVQANSGTENAWASYLGVANASAQSCAMAQDPSHVIFENNAAPIQADPNSSDAIYFYSIGVHAVSGGQSSLLQSVANSGGASIAPTKGNVQNQSFPVIRGLYMVTSAKPTADTKAYVGPTSSGWVCKDATKHSINPFTNNNYAVDIAAVISNNGFVQLPDINHSNCAKVTT